VEKGVGVWALNRWNNKKAFKGEGWRGKAFENKKSKMNFH
jgi:hypothetical protein